MTVQVNGPLIKELRLKRSLSQERLAEIVGVNLRTIQRVEISGAASLSTRAALATAFGVVSCIGTGEYLRTLLEGPTMPTSVTAVPPADSILAAKYFEDCLTFETDCWDVHEAMSAGDMDFVLLDVRSALA